MITSEGNNRRCRYPGQEENMTEIKQQKTSQNIKETTAKDESTKQKKRKRRRKAVIGLLVKLLILAAVIYALFFIIIGVTIMPSGDMYPRVDAGDLVLYYRLDKDVKAQDIIVFEKDMNAVMSDAGLQGAGSSAYSAMPVNVRTTGTELFVSRVVAVAGDTVEVTENGNLVINGSTMIESGIFYSTYPYRGYTEYPVTLKEGECFVLADSRQGGADSRFFGPVSVNEIKGTVITILRRNNL